MLRIIFSLAVILLSSQLSWGQTVKMQFAAYPPDSIYEKMMGDHAWRVFATGEIDADVAKRLTALIKSKRIPPGSMLYLNSPGGSLLGGMALGRAIRANGFNTAVGQFDPKLKYVGSKPGYCYSACATAFLGGVFRYWTDGSIYGVHRFFWKGGTGGNADLAQIMSAALIEYIQSMGVDTKIFSLASEAGPSEVVTPSHQLLLELRVMNDGRKATKWSIESISQKGAGAIYLKGERDTDNGINKFIIGCPSNAPMFLLAIFDVGQNANQVMTWPVNWLFLDERTIRMDGLLESKKIINGKMNLTYGLNTALLKELSKAKTVGVGLQGGVGAAIFSGFNRMPFSGGAAKLPALMAVCHNRTH